MPSLGTKKRTKASNNKTIRRPAANKYPLIPLPLVNKLEALAEFYDISLVSRGKIPPNTTDKGFLVVYRSVGGDSAKLAQVPILSKNPNGNTWDRQRENYILRRLNMLKRAKYGLYVKDGDLAGLPTVLHVNMMMWAYSPEHKKINSEWVDKILTRLSEIKKRGVKAPSRPGISAYGNRDSS